MVREMEPEPILAILPWIMGGEPSRTPSGSRRTVWELPREIEESVLYQSVYLHRRVFGPSGQPLPVDIMRLARACRVLSVRRMAGIDRRASRTEGLTTPTAGGFEIVLLEAITPSALTPEERWVVAHEIGHTCFYAIKSDSEVPVNLLPDLTGLGKRRLELVCDALGHHLLLPPARLPDLVDPVGREFSFDAIERAAASAGVTEHLLAWSMAEDRSLRTPGQAILIVEDLPNIYTGKDVALRVAAVAQAARSTTFIPVNQSARSLGLRALSRFEAKDVDEVPIAEELVTVNVKDPDGRYRERETPCYAKYHRYRSAAREYIIALLEFPGA